MNPNMPGGSVQSAQLFYTFSPHTLTALCSCLVERGTFFYYKKRQKVNEWLYWWMISPHTVPGLGPQSIPCLGRWSCVEHLNRSLPSWSFLKMPFWNSPGPNHAPGHCRTLDLHRLQRGRIIKFVYKMFLKSFNCPEVNTWHHSVWFPLGDTELFHFCSYCIFHTVAAQ